MRFITLISYTFCNSPPILKHDLINHLHDLQLLTIFKTVLSLIQRLEVAKIGLHTLVEHMQYHVSLMIAGMLESPNPLVAGLLKLSGVQNWAAGMYIIVTDICVQWLWLTQPLTAA